jgi:hypothetical protein
MVDYMEWLEECDRPLQDNEQERQNEDDNSI